MNRWRVVLILAAGQFVMVLDGTVMNVSISQLVKDLNTSVTSIQIAITAYTLVMAAFMLTGGKFGDILGRRRAFVIGLGIYGAGSLITAIAPNIGVLLLGWSLVEGLGAVLVVPSIMALTAANYQGKDRALAYGILGGVAAAGVAIGPLIGGWVTTNYSWRYVFAAETVIVIVLIFVARLIADAPHTGERERLDGIGTFLSALGFGLTVFAMLQSSTWGWVAPRTPPTIGGTELTPFGFAPTLFVIATGLAVLYGFKTWQDHRLEREQSVLVHPELLNIPPLRAGLVTLLLQQVFLAGTFFVLPLYLQVVLNLDALHSGKHLLPLSIAMFITAMVASRVGAKYPPRTLVRIGFGVMFVAEGLLLSVIDTNLRSRPFSLALGLLGVGMGLLASQLGNVIQSSVELVRSSEAAGLQGTAQNLGASIGTALIGAILLGGLTTGFQTQIAQSTKLAPEVRTEIADRASGGLQFVATSAVEQVATDAGLPRSDVDAIVESYSAAQIRALKSAVGTVALLIFVGFGFTSRLPKRPLTAPDDPVVDAVPDEPIAVGAGPE